VRPWSWTPHAGDDREYRRGCSARRVDMGELLRHSDTRCTRRKTAPHNFQLFSPHGRRLKERIAIESSLRTALQSGQLDVHYQPIVDMDRPFVAWRRCCAGSIRAMIRAADRFVSIAEEAA